MIKILLIEKDIDYSKTIVDYINTIDLNIKIYGLAYSIDEIFEILLKEEFDLIILDLDNSNKDFKIFFDFLKKKILIIIKNLLSY